jgi:hypothetical protein
MVHAAITVAALAARMRQNAGVSGAALELVAGVLLLAPRPSAAVIARVTSVAAGLEARFTAHRVAVREGVILSDIDLLRPEVALCRPLALPHAPRSEALALVVFVGEQEGPLRWRAQRCGRAGVPEAWTMAVADGRASRWREPGPHGYRRRDALTPGAPLALDAAPERQWVAWWT